MTKTHLEDTAGTWLLQLEPEESTEMHMHRHLCLWVGIDGGPLDCHDEYGNQLGIFGVATDGI